MKFVYMIWLHNIYCTGVAIIFLQQIAILPPMNPILPIGFKKLCQECFRMFQVHHPIPAIPTFSLTATENLPPKYLLHLLHVLRCASPAPESASCLGGFAASALHCKHHMHLDVRLEHTGVRMFLHICPVGFQLLCYLLFRGTLAIRPYLSQNISLGIFLPFFCHHDLRLSPKVSMLTALDALLTNIQASTMDPVIPHAGHVATSQWHLLRVTQSAEGAPSVPPRRVQWPLGVKVGMAGSQFHALLVISQDILCNFI